MQRNAFILTATILATLASGPAVVSAASKAAEPPSQLNEAGRQTEERYAALLAALRSEITKGFPGVAEQKKQALQKAREALKRAEAQKAATEEPTARVKAAAGLVEHAKGKWIGGAEKGIAQAQAALQKATSDAQREAAAKDLAKWEANKQDGLRALKERQAALDKANAELAGASQANQAAEAALARARAEEQGATLAILQDLEPFLASDKMDAKLVRGSLLAEATPKRLAAFAQQGREQQALLEKLLADDKLMLEMLVAGGARSGRYGEAMQIYSAIQKASPQSREGAFQRLALGTSLEHAVPVEQSNAEDQKNAPATVDPIKRYQHYEKACLAGELDPAFKSFTAWEYRMVVDCDAPDEILAWGREMLRNYRPDHIANADYGWRYAATVRTEVRYGSQCVKDDLPSLNKYQNIPKDGGVCGRRAFFGRFILRSFGIPVWGVTQPKHAALSHWTPQGWVINLGAGFPVSWWDKDDAPRSGPDFLLETQARAKADDYRKVLRAQWVSRLLGEQPYNDRQKTEGGFWSNAAHCEAMTLAAHAVALKPLGQELAEANESPDPQSSGQTAQKPAGLPATASPAGSTITIPAAGAGRSSGAATAMKSYAGGQQLHCQPGYRADYDFTVARAGRYALSARVATLQEGQRFLLATNGAKEQVEIPVPYTVGSWQETKAIEVNLVQGKNKLNFALKEGSRAVTLKEFTLAPLQ